MTLQNQLEVKALIRPKPFNKLMSLNYIQLNTVVQSYQIVFQIEDELNDILSSSYSHRKIYISLILRFGGEKFTLKMCNNSSYVGLR